MNLPQARIISPRLFSINQKPVVSEKKLSSTERGRLPKSSFALPKDRKYPIHDRSHAANALSRVAANGTSAQKKTVRAKVCRKYPNLPSCS